MALLASDVAGDVARKLLCDVPLMMQPAAKTDKLAKPADSAGTGEAPLEKAAAAAARPECADITKCVDIAKCADNPSVLNIETGHLLNEEIKLPGRMLNEKELAEREQSLKLGQRNMKLQRGEALFALDLEKKAPSKHRKSTQQAQDRNAGLSQTALWEIVHLREVTQMLDYRKQLL